MPSNCGVCGNPFVDDESDQKIKCAGNCDIQFHARCIQNDVDGTKTRSFKDWKCKNCRSSSAPATIEVSNDSTKELLKAIEEFKQQVFGELKSTRTDINDLAHSMQFVSNKMDESTALMKEIKSELAAVKKDNENLRNMNAALTSEVSCLKTKIRSLEQYSRKSNLEISGLPETPKEDAVCLVKDVGAALGVEIQESDISAAHRVPSFRKDRPQPLIVQFTRRTTRDTLLNKFKDNKTMTAKQINAAFPAQNVYVNEHLTPENKLFLSKLKEKCKEVGFSYAWCRDGKFFARKSQGERYIKIENYDDFNKLK